MQVPIPNWLTQEFRALTNHSTQEFRALTNHDTFSKWRLCAMQALFRDFYSSGRRQKPEEFWGNVLNKMDALGNKNGI